MLQWKVIWLYMLLDMSFSKFFQRSFSEMKTKTEHGVGRYTSYNPGIRKGCHNLLLQCRCIFGICLIGIKPHVIFSFALDRTSAYKIM